MDSQAAALSKLVVLVMALVLTGLACGTSAAPTPVPVFENESPTALPSTPIDATIQTPLQATVATLPAATVPTPTAIFTPQTPTLTPTATLRPKLPPTATPLPYKLCLSP